MPRYEVKQCLICGEFIQPKSPKQKMCSLCAPVWKKVKQAERDKIRNRKKHNKLYRRECPICNNIFETYDSKRKYCGKASCERERVYIKNKNYHQLRNKTSLINKGKKCYNKNRKDILVKKVEQSREQISTVNGYVKSYVEKECPEEHLRQTSFHDFKGSGNRCLKYYHQNNYISNPEKLVRDFIEETFPDLNVIYNNRTLIAPKGLDLYFPDNNLAIEVCGLYQHGELHSGKDRKYHYNKMMACYDKGVRLITIFEDELLEHKEIVFSRIKQALGRPSRRIFARKCNVYEITSKAANTFYRENHIQGKSTAMIRFGLYYEQELVCVASLGRIIRKHTSTENTLELKRFCTLQGVSVIGGVGKIFKRMKKYAKDNGYTVIKSYCDMRYGNIFKPVYEVLGFKLVTFTKYTPHYTKDGKRYRNFSLRKTPEERLSGKTEWELRKEQGYDRIWDCGHRTYEYYIE